MAQAREARINLDRAEVLLVDGNPQGLDILAQVFAGFGVRNAQRCESADEAREAAARTPFDLMVVDGELTGDMDGFDFVHWLRRSKLEPNAYAPVIIVAGHTRASKVTRARDCGANFMVAKPLAPATLLERVLWVAREQRPFIECDAYVGPDRRFKREGPPAGMAGRRKDDLSADVGAAVEANMSQDDIDSMIQPQRAR